MASSAEWLLSSWLRSPSWWYWLGSWWAFLLLLDWLRKMGRALCRMVYPYWVAPVLWSRPRVLEHCSAGDWAVVTGATDGIGKEYALELGRLGLNLVLIGRNESKLDKVKAAFQDALGEQEVRTILFDFAVRDERGYGEIEAQLSGLPVSVLVNNVGQTYEELGPVGSVPDGERLAADLLRVNCLSATLMSRLVVTGMAGRGRGAIINICSVAASFNAPFLAIYGACKAYVAHLSRAMAAEYANSGLVIQAVFPYFVDTKMGRMKRNFAVPCPRHYARQALATFGRQSESFGCFSHSCQGESMSLLYQPLADCVMFYSLRNLMRRQQRKLARQKAQ